VAAKPYTLLQKALERSSKVAVAKYAWSGRERLGLLRVRDNVIVLHAMRWSDEIRNPAEPKPDEVELTDAEIAQAEQLIDRLTRDDLEGEEFTDRYTEAVEQLIEAKREHREPPAAADRPGHRRRRRRPPRPHLTPYAARTTVRYLSPDTAA
jgi:DNA end-binding protein Ku